MTEALLITLTGTRIIKVPTPPPPVYMIVRHTRLVSTFAPTTNVPRPTRHDRVCQRITRSGERPPVYEEVPDGV